MPKVTRRDLVLLVIGLDELGNLDNPALGGITRLQKYIYLLECEEGLRPEGEGFSFTAYKKGPYSPKLYDDLEFLQNLDLLTSSVTDIATDDEAEEFEALTFDYLMGNDDAVKASEEGRIAEEGAYEERRFQLTPKGLKKVQALISDENMLPLVQGIRKVKGKFSNHSLNDLLHYVYTRHPEMTTESDIRDKVLAHRPKS